MDALALLNQQLDVERILNHYEFQGMKTVGKYTRACCKMHDGNEPTAFVMNHDDGRWFCHTGDCGGGDVYHLIQHIEGITFTQSVKRLSEILNVDIADLEITDRTRKQLNEVKQWVQAIRASKKKGFHPYEPIGDAKQIKAYLDFNISTLDAFGITYYKEIEATRGNGESYTLHNRIGFPLFFDGVQVGISLRRTNPQERAKWIHQPTSIETGNMLYNYDRAIGQSEVVVVEGITDVWAYHEIGVLAVATFGAKLSKEQIRLLIKTGADIVLSYDGDEAGIEGMKKAIDDMKYIANLKTIDIPDGKDPASIARETLRELHLNRRSLYEI